MARVAIVGAGMAGASCAAELVAAGVSVTIFERGRAPGGRMASPRLHDRRTDIGAGYFTVADDGFARVVESWTSAGLAREWTDTFTVFSLDGHTTASGPMRYATPGGLRSLVRDVLPEGVEVRTQRPIGAVTDVPEEFDAVVLAMPDPQARRVAPDAASWVDYEPVISLSVGWSERQWQPFDAAFVNDDADISFAADDGARRGDAAPVLVVHSTSERAGKHLDAPVEAERPMLDALRRVMAIGDDPMWTHTHRWTFAKPDGTHDEAAFGLVESGGRPLGLCTDSWCPSGKPRVESAWLSGRDLARRLAESLK